MRSKQMLVRCGLLAVVVMSTCVSAAPSPGQLWPGLASGLAGLEATSTPQVEAGPEALFQVETPVLAYWGVDWYGRLWLWLSCPTSGATIRYTVDGSDPQYDSPLYVGPLVFTGNWTLKVRAFRDGQGTSDILVINIRW